MKPPQIRKRLLQIWVLTVTASLSREQIGDALGISPRTVEAYQNRLRKRLGMRTNDRAGLVRAAAGPLFFR